MIGDQGSHPRRPVTLVSFPLQRKLLNPEWTVCSLPPGGLPAQEGESESSRKSRPALPPAQPCQARSALRSGPASHDSACPDRNLHSVPRCSSRDPLTSFTGGTTLPPGLESRLGSEGLVVGFGGGGETWAGTYPREWSQSADWLKGSRDPGLDETGQEWAGRRGKSAQLEGARGLEEGASGRHVGTQGAIGSEDCRDQGLDWAGGGAGPAQFCGIEASQGKGVGMGRDFEMAGDWV